MPAIETPLDAALDAWQARTSHERRSLAAFDGHRKKALADPATHPLRRHRLAFRGHGLSVKELSERSTVGESTIRAVEAGGDASDQTWARLLLGLGLNPAERNRIDQNHVR